MIDLKHSLRDAIAWCAVNKILIPDDLASELTALGVAIKTVGDITAISAQYHDAMTQAIVEYFTDVRRLQDARNDAKRACANAFGDGFETGWLDGGGEPPIDEDANAWLSARYEAEFGFIDMLFQQIRELKKDKEGEDLDYFSFATARADGYTASLFAVYSEGKLRAAGNKMLTFVGQDGSPDHICQSTGGTCVRLMGQRHRASWWVSHGLIPGPGNGNYDCGGWNCQHRLESDNGEVFAG